MTRLLGPGIRLGSANLLSSATRDRAGPYTLGYDSAKKMQKFEVAGLRKCSHASFDLISSDGGKERTFVILDNVRIVRRQGETF